MTRRMKIVVGLVLFAVMYAAGIVAFEREQMARTLVLNVGDAKQADRVDFEAHVLSMDANKGETTVRLDFKPAGNLVGADKVTLTKDLKVYANSATGGQERTFPKGKPMNAFDVVLDLDGSLSDFPIDKYVGALEVSVKTGADEAIPVMGTFTGALHGLSLDVHEEARHGVGFAAFEFCFTRSPATLAVAGFIIIMTWAMTIAVGGVALSVMAGNRKLEFGQLGWTGGLLFALIAFRGATPGAPPIGALSDYLSFFWAELIVAASLAALVWAYLTRPAA